MKFDLERHRRSIRLKEYDYAQVGAYFVTIVTYQRECLLGEIVNEEMCLSKFGLVAKGQWEKLPRRFPNVELSTFVIMPNHVHGIIQIVGESRRVTATNQNNHDGESSRRDPTTETTRRAPPIEQFGKPVKGSIPTIVRSYKSAVTYRINLIRGVSDVPVWQHNYYEHVVRDDKDWDRIHRYIEFNPFMWARDEENPLNT